MTERRRLGDLEPDLEMWEALRRGDGLTEILTDFYARVYEDPRLAHFFAGVTKARAIEKQYQFLRQIFSGEPVYFGDRPRNAHHWMVISDELFDYREELMADCLKRHGLAEHLVVRWRAVEEIFRKQIVKSEPRGKRLGGVELPFDGHAAVQLAVGTLCDGCSGPLEQGTTAQYHVRTGRTYCEDCVPAATLRPPPSGWSEQP